MLYNSKIPSYNGGGSVNKNIGEIENKGFEITLSATPVDKEHFQWDAAINVSAYKNKLVSLGKDTFFLGGNYADGLTLESPFAIKVGESLGSFWGYTWEGIYTTAEAGTPPVYQTNPDGSLTLINPGSGAARYGFNPGDNKYKDINNDGKIDSKDKHIIGNALPKLVWGFNTTLSYRNLEFNMMLQASLGREILNTVYAGATTLLADATAISHVDGLDYWRPDNENANFANPNTSTGKNFIESTRFLQDGSYVKLKNIAIAYNLNRKVIKYADLKFVISGQNLLTFTKYKGYDPESSTSDNDIDGAIDVGAYPNPRSVTFSIQANF
ncbi:MAG: hypothetical protein HC830_06355 [Bacteroidetes bacterium]|nr:hypothetical protein [Bacteroidota bacterium]